jgi:tripartite-type tricarboxylate transporter receptor subunit TctC
MSALGQKRTLRKVQSMSALLPKADMVEHDRDVRFVPLGKVTGSPQAVMDVIAGRAMMTFSPSSTVVGQVAAGKLRALATAANKRANALPDVPTMAEAGMSDFDTSLWFGLFAPAGTPRPVIDKIADAARKAMSAPKALDTLRKQGYEPLNGGPDEFGAYIRSETARWSEVARKAGLLKN